MIRRCFSSIATALAATAALSFAVVTLGQPPTNPAQPTASDAAVESPTAVAERGAKALKEERFGDYAKLVHSEERERFRRFAIAVMDAADEADVLHVIGGFFRDAASQDQIAKADSADVLADFLKAMAEQVPELEQAKQDLTFEALGEVKENAKLVHVVCKTGGPKADVVTCAEENGEWRTALPGQVQALMAKAGRLKNAAATPENPLAALDLLLPDELVSVSVLGAVKETDDLVWIVCRTGQGRGGDVHHRVDAYPIKKTEPAWNYLDPRKRRELEAGLLQSWRAEMAGRNTLQLP